MSVEQVVPGLYAIPLGWVNAFLIDSDALVLVDTGIPDSADMILHAVQVIGRKSSDVRHILVTHCHPDHAGSLAEMKKRTGASAYMHPLDAAITRTGKVAPDLKPAPVWMTCSANSSALGAPNMTRPALNMNFMMLTSDHRWRYPGNSCAGSLHRTTCVSLAYSRGRAVRRGHGNQHDGAWLSSRICRF
jgi:ribonuclease BN (tRNA processing enzyme)